MNTSSGDTSTQTTFSSTTATKSATKTSTSLTRTTSSLTGTTSTSRSTTTSASWTVGSRYSSFFRVGLDWTSRSLTSDDDLAAIKASRSGIVRLRNVWDPILIQKLGQADIQVVIIIDTGVFSGTFNATAFSAQLRSNLNGLRAAGVTILGLQLDDSTPEIPIDEATLRAHLPAYSEAAIAARRAVQAIPAVYWLISVPGDNTAGDLMGFHQAIPAGFNTQGLNLVISGTSFVEDLGKVPAWQPTFVTRIRSGGNIRAIDDFIRHLCVRNLRFFGVMVDRVEYDLLPDKYQSLFRNHNIGT